MKFKDFSKEGNPEFEPKNPKVIKRRNYYEIDFDAVYEDGHVEKKTGFGSYIYDVIKGYLRDYFEINEEE